MRLFMTAAQGNGTYRLSHKSSQVRVAKAKNRLWLRVGVSSILVTLLLVAHKQLGKIQFLELLTYDHLVRTFSHRKEDPRLLVVTITEQDIQQQQRWPLSDGVIAQALNTLQTYQPKTIGLDIFRDIPHVPGTEQLTKELQASNVIAVNQLPTPTNKQGISAPSHIPAHRLGFADLVIDADNIVRRYLMHVQSPSGKIQANSFALQVALHYLDTDDLMVEHDSLKINQVVFPRLQANAGGYQLSPKEASGWQTLVKYQRPAWVRKITLTQLLEEKFDPDWVKDKVILIGVTAPSGKDRFPTPHSRTQTQNFEMSGVIIHGQMVSQILSTVLDGDRLFWFWTEWLEWAWIGVWCLAGGLLVWNIDSLWRLGGAMIIAGLSLWGIGLLIFTQSGWIPIISPLFGLLTTGTCVLAYKVIYRTYYDALTELPNRRLFLSQTQLPSPSVSSSENLFRAVLLIDLDRFKAINDSLGYEAGDHLLIQIAQRLQEQINSQMILGRVGGDEFAICWKQINDPHRATILAEGIKKEFTKPFYWQEQTIYVTASMGIAFKPIDQHFQADELLRHADIAMVRAKELGITCYERFIAGMDTQALERWQLETDLRAALHAEEFQLYYQPILSLKTKQIAGFEALVRWISPKRGFISPGDFIPLAEETGLIVPLGQWILQEACQQIHDWHEKFPHVPPLIMSVNLSSRQLTQPNLVKQIQDTLKKIKVSGNYLKLEITESMMMNDVEAAIQLLRRLKALGLQLSIDDFGTGYSSLSYLHRFPIDTLKVDRSFVSPMELRDDQKKYIDIVRTIIDLGHNLGLDVIAEGIETEEQLQILESLNCNYGQGYLFSKPLTAQDAEALLVENN